MSTVKISPKGMALIRNRALASAVNLAIVKGGNKLYTTGITVKTTTGFITIKSPNK